MAKIKNPLIVVRTTIGGGTSKYSRPTDWLTIPTMTGASDEIYILNGVGLNDLNKIYFRISGTGTIDWGDGNTESFTGATKQTFEHSYNYNNISDSSYTEHNKTKQVLIHITGIRGMISYFSTGNITYQFTNADGVSSNYDNTISTNIYEMNINVESCEVYCCSYSGQRHEKLEIFDLKGTITNTNMNYMFSNCYSLQSIPQLDTSKVTSMSSMFSNCHSLQSIPQLDTSSVTNMSSMFSSCYSLQSIPQLDTSKVTSMSSMFSNCHSLQSIPQLDTSSVTNMSSMFASCYSLQSIPQLDTSKVTNTSSMFSNCYALQSVPQLDTSKVTSMNSMFSSCYSLQSIPQLDTSSVTNMSYMFQNCYSLTNPKTYKAGASSQTSINLSNLMNNKFMTKQQLIDLFNSVCPNTVSGNTRTLQLGSTLQGYLADCYVKDSGEAYTAILPTSDTTPDSSKTYYTYNEITGEYTQFTSSAFATGTSYYELKTATWNKFVIGESTDTGAKLALSWFTGTDTANGEKGWTVS